MATKRRRTTNKGKTRDVEVSLNTVFTDIADAIRLKASGSDPIYPANMGNAIRAIKNVEPASLPESNLPAIFQDIADAIRSCGVSGTMTATQMALKVADIVLPQPTRVTYTQASGLSDWSGDIVGEIAGTSTSPYYTTQIPNAQYIETVSIGENVTSIGNYAFRDCSSLTSISLPDDITGTIGSWAFGQTRITSITIPDSITGIGTSIFNGCTNLENITIGSGITIISARAFTGCSSLTGLTFPSGITNINGFAFSGCSNCELYDFRNATAVPTLSNVSVFNNTSSTKKIVVPDSLYNTWIAANNWSSSTNGIVEAIIRASDYEFNIQIEGLTNNSFTGRTLYCKAMKNGQITTGTWSITSGSQYATINENGRVDINSGVQSQSITISCTEDGQIKTKTITISYDNQLTIEGSSSMSGTSGTVVARYNGAVVTPTWSITSGNSNATIGNDGAITIIQSGDITVQATYSNYTTTRDIELTYVANTTSQTIVDGNGAVTTQTSTVVQNQDGSTTTSTTATTTNEDGSTSSTQAQTTANQDGSSTTTSTTTNQDGSSSQTNSTTTAPDQNGTTTTSTSTTYYDDNGDATGSQTIARQDNSDGSSTSTSTDYDENGGPTHQTNEEVDTDGNASTQNIDYDDNGDQKVTGYTIDTSGNEDGTKEFNLDIVNTEFYGFDSVEGFIMNIHFTIDFTDQPANQNEGLHNILTMKRANPSPWYGFQIRHSGTTKYVQLGTQFEFGSNTNTTINPNSSNWIVQNQIAEYNIQVTYDPTLFSNTFVARELISNRQIYTSNYLFPDLPELRYLTVCLGCALDENGDPYRYSKINVLNFSLQKLVHPPAVPNIAFTDNTITLTCETQGASIYYKMGGTSTYTLYTAPIEISQDVTVQAYSSMNNHDSEVATMVCVYDDGIDEPVITCDGEYVEVNCGTSGADTYYRIGTSGSWLSYDSPFEINATTTVQAYSIIDNKQSEIVTETCTYVPVTLVEPNILCNDNVVVLTCSTPRSSIYYRTGGTGDYQLYQEPFSIVEDTLVEAYSTYKNQTSTTVYTTCEFTPEHDYSQDYLTFRALTSGTICWKAFGSLTKTIEYKKNNGSWTSITSSAAGETISVDAGDTVKFRSSSNTTYATSKSAYSGFDGGTAEIDIEGNIMSLLYGDGFASNTALTNSTYQFCSIFKKALVVSARNLILPATTMKNYCYRAMFSWCTTLISPPELPATTLAQGCYWYMFEQCSITKAPVLDATTMVSECYGHMFEGCALLNTIECYATAGFSSSKCREDWVKNVASSGMFVKSSDATSWATGTSGIPTNWVVSNDVLLYPPEISFDGETIELSCATSGAEIYYRLGQSGNYSLYEMPISILDDTIIETYSSYQNHDSAVVTQTCVYVQETPFQQSNKSLP